MPVKVKPDAFTYDGGQIGLLLVHGFTGSAAEMLPMGDYFHERGLTVHAPLLAGHGTTPEDMRKTRWPDWRASVDEGVKLIRQLGCTQIFAAGLSMGGTLVLDLAQRFNLAGVIPMCAPVKLKDKRSWMAPFIHYFWPYLERDETKPEHIEQAIVPYDRTPIACVASLRQLIRKVCRHLPNIQTPAFIAQACQDETVELSSARTIYDGLSSRYKVLRWYAQSSHIITLDHEKEQLFHDIEEFIRHVSEQHRAGSET